jgi:hypothetical protein
MVILAEDNLSRPRRVKVEPAFEDDIKDAFEASHYGQAPRMVDLSADEQIELVLIIAIID